MRYAIYARVSSDIQSQFSTSDQIRQCESFVSDRGGKVIGIYIDEAVSGADITRANYQLLKADAYSGKFDAIVVDDLSRIGRDMPEFAAFCRDLNDTGIILYGVSDGIDTSNPSAKIPLYFKGIMNELFLDDLKAKIVRGLKGQFLRGYSTGGRVYGYRTKQILDPSRALDKFGRPKRLGCKIQIDPKQAKIVRRIFQFRLSGLGLKSIAKLLNKEKIPSPHAGCGSRRGLWSPSTIRGILLNPKYISVWEYNKTRWSKKSVVGKRKTFPNPRDQWERFETDKLRIISNKLFETVNNSLSRTRRNSSGCKKYLLSGLLICGECGGSLLVVNSGRYSCYMCGTARSQGSQACSNRRRVSRAAIESAFVSEIRKALLDDKVASLIASEVNQKLGQRIGSDKASLTLLKQQKFQLIEKINCLLDSLESGSKMELIRNRLLERQNELKKIESEINQLESIRSNPIKVSKSWVQDKLLGLTDLLEKHRESLLLIRNELRLLFPAKLSVTARDNAVGTDFNVKGSLNPFNLLFASELQLSIIAVQGYSKG